jgi:hypothetical protein
MQDSWTERGRDDESCMGNHAKFVRSLCRGYAGFVGYPANPARGSPAFLRPKTLFGATGATWNYLNKRASGSLQNGHSAETGQCGWSPHIRDP